MVRIEVKVKHEQNCDGSQVEFLYDCLGKSEIDEIAHEIIQISNIQYKINRLANELHPRLIPFHANPKAIPLIRALSEAKSYASKEQVLYNKPISYSVLRDHVQAIEREVMENYQLLGFQHSNQFNQLLTDMELFQEETTQLCWAGKQLMRDKQLCDYVGKNDKTKIVIRLQPLNPHPA